MSDVRDDLIQATVAFREAGLTCAEALDLVHDCFVAPWSDAAFTPTPGHTVEAEPSDLRRAYRVRA